MGFAKVSVVKAHVEMIVGANGSISLAELREFVNASNYLMGNAIVEIRNDSGVAGTILSTSESLSKQVN